MKTNGYFNNLEKYWSANFLALLASVNLFAFITWAFFNLIYFIFKVSSFSEYMEFVQNSYNYGWTYIFVFFPISCFLVACISIFYILMIISRKKWSLITCSLIILIGWCIFFAISREPLNFEQGTGIFIAFYFLPMSVIAIPISLGIYLILLLFERFPKFRVPISLISQNNLFKKYIRFFYWFYFIIIFAIIWLVIYGLSQS